MSATDTYTSKIEKHKHGWYWHVFENGVEVAGDVASTKKFAITTVDGLISFYKKLS